MTKHVRKYTYLPPKFSQNGIICIMLFSMFALLFVYQPTPLGLTLQASDVMDSNYGGLVQEALPFPRSNAEAGLRRTQQLRQISWRLACEASWRTKNQREQLDDIMKECAALLWNMIYEDKHKLIYCYVPKVATTQLKMVMAILAGTLPNVPMNKIPVEGWLSHETTRHKFLGNTTLTDEEVYYRLANYRKFIFVRDPLTRLVSAYYDKFVRQKGGVPYVEPFRRYLKEIIPRYRTVNGTKPLDVTEEMYNQTVPFHEFVQWITDSNFSSEGTTNYHWHPVSQLCFPCAIDYDFIGNMETLSEDLALLFKKFGITEVGYTMAFTSSTPKMVPKMVEQLRSEDLRAVMHKFKADVETFGYLPHPIGR